MAAQLGIGVRVLVHGKMYPVYIGTIVNGPYQDFYPLGEDGFPVGVIKGVSWEVTSDTGEPEFHMCSESLLTPIDGGEDLEEDEEKARPEDEEVTS